MEFKMFLLCFAVLFAATSADSVCKCEDKKESVYKYELKIKDGVKEIEEEVKIDTEQNTETYRILQRDGNAGEVNILYDIKKNVTMLRISSAKACFMSEFDEAIPKPRDLVLLLDQIKRNKLWTKFTNTTKVEYHVLSTVTDRSDLSDEVAFMCAKLPIYRVKKTTPFSVMVRRVKRCHGPITTTVTYICGYACSPPVQLPGAVQRCYPIYCTRVVIIRKCH